MPNGSTPAPHRSSGRQWHAVRRFVVGVGVIVTGARGGDCGSRPRLLPIAHAGGFHMTVGEAAVAAAVVFKNMLVDQTAQGSPDLAADGAANNTAQSGGSDGSHDGTCWASNRADDHAHAGSCEDAGDTAGCARDSANSPADAAGQIAVTSVLVMAIGTDDAQGLSFASEQVKWIHWEVLKSWMEGWGERIERIQATT